MKNFNKEDQILFAELSGDCNPIHLDAVKARRMIYGKVVVHGIHTLLWVLNEWSAEKKYKISLKSINAMFLFPTQLESSIMFKLEKDDEEMATLLVIDEDGNISTKIKITYEINQPISEIIIPNQSEECRSCDDLSDELIKGYNGSEKLYVDKELLEKMFPELVSKIPLLQIAVLISTTRIIGMKCPGLNSIYNGLNISFLNKISKNLELKYYVTEFDRRFSKIQIKIENENVDGFLDAFYRPKQITQPSFLEVKKFVFHDEFKNQKALVFGGSRGIGEVTAKILAAGGADVRLTYYKGKVEAEKIISEIRSEGGTADANFLDISNLPDNFNKITGDWRPTHIYYYVTPFIFEGKKNKYSYKLFKKFCDYYIYGFIEIINLLNPRSSGLKKVFYPSSIAVEEMPLNMFEYTVAKTAGEMVCKYISKINKDIDVYCERLPRLETDQTVSLFPVDNAKTIDIILELIRKMEKVDGKS